jgi:hypothetical protein
VRARQARGDVQDAVAQALGLAAGEYTIEQQTLCPGEEVVRDADEHQLDAVVLEVAERQVPEAGVLVVADLRFGGRALALAALEDLNVGAGLVGQDRLEAMAVVAVNESCAPGCARSRRMITRDPVGHVVRSRDVVISAICPFSRGVPSVASAAIHASSRSFRVAARTGSLSS